MNRLSKKSAIKKSAIKKPATSKVSAVIPPGAQRDFSARRPERTVLVHIDFSPSRDRGPLEELELLATSAGARVCARVTGRRRAPDAATFVGKGKAEEIRDQVTRQKADLVLVNHAVSPVQERNLEKILGCPVSDRTALILDIFAQRASSHEGKLQVELAQLKHLSTRLVRGWTHLERQKGGIGLRGPGETQLETDRRLIGGRIKSLQRRLQKVRAQRGQRRKARLKVPVPTISLVGYTNAGKSSLFNRLTAAGVYEADQLFATLDPTMRRLDIPHFGHVVFTDTVGFIRQLPHSLVEAFRATMEEVSSAALLVHVVDASSAERRDNMGQVERVLEEIGAAGVPRIRVFNKIDRLERPAECARDAQGRIDRVWLSAKTGQGVDLLIRAISEHFRRNRIHRRLRLPASAGGLRAKLYRRLGVLQETLAATGEWVIDVELEPSQLVWLERQKGAGMDILQGGTTTVLAHYRSSP